MSEPQHCPHCGEECYRDEVDVGVGTMVGPWGCPGCGWSNDPAYDHSEGKTAPKQAEYPEWYVDQWGSMVRKNRLKKDCKRFGIDPDKIDEVFP